MNDPLVERAADYYARKLAEFGATPKGADWNGHESQELRFSQLLRVCGDDPLAITDYGCGYGALARYLRASGRPFTYYGYDAAAPMIAAAKQFVGDDPLCRFSADREQVEPQAFAIASGIFNVRETTPDDAWWDYIVRTLDDLASLGTSGFSANFLTWYSDADRQRADLYYADPSEVLRHCLARFSRRAVLLHDYPLYEFTILVRR